MFPTWSDWNISYTRKGLRKKRTKTFLRYLVYFAAIAGAVNLQRRGQTAAGVKALLRSYARKLLFIGAGTLQKAAEKV
jgi:hypothetical protein